MKSRIRNNAGVYLTRAMVVHGSNAKLFVVQMPAVRSGSSEITVMHHVGLVYLKLTKDLPALGLALALLLSQMVATRRQLLHQR
jgi:hypothetical protein